MDILLHETRQGQESGFVHEPKVKWSEHERPKNQEKQKMPGY